jgi:multiple antibiotic resistance protein
MRDFIYTFIPLFVAMDIGGLIPVYLALTRNLSVAEKHRVGVQALSTGFAISLAFIVAGRFIFSVLGISVADFEIAGGLVLLVLAVVDLVRSGGKEAAPGRNVGPVPLGTPLLVGPAVLTTLLILTSLRGYPMTLLALAVNFALALFAFQFSQRLVLWMGENGLRATSKVISLFLAAIAVSMIRRGIFSLR